MSERVFYGPHSCALCGATICKASRHHGSEEFDYPDGPIYPNTVWVRHNCPGVSRPEESDVKLST